MKLYAFTSNYNVHLLADQQMIPIDLDDARYVQLIKDYGTLRYTIDYSTIPRDPNNSDYQHYLVWISEGNIVDILEKI